MNITSIRRSYGVFVKAENGRAEISADMVTEDEARTLAHQMSRVLEDLVIRYKLDPKDILDDYATRLGVQITFNTEEQ